MEKLELGKFIVQLMIQCWERLIFFTICNQGEAIIKKRLGHPIKWRTKPGVYWKFPLIDNFDKVDMRSKYAQFSAHSFHVTLKEDSSIIPYNILIDFQAEYNVVNPLVIYEATGFMYEEDITTSYISNTIHAHISKLINQKATISYKDIESLFIELSNKLKIDKYTSCKETEFDSNFLKRKRINIDISKCISINNIVLTSFDKNISIRTTI